LQKERKKINTLAVAVMQRIQPMPGVVGFVIAVAPPQILIKILIKNAVTVVLMISSNTGIQAWCKPLWVMEILKRILMGFAVGFVFQ
jgi:hypothetical protein